MSNEQVTTEWIESLVEAEEAERQREAKEIRDTALILEATTEFFDDTPEKWTKKTYARSAKTNRAVKIDSPAAGSFCIMGGITRVSRDLHPDEYTPPPYFVRRILREV